MESLYPGISYIAGHTAAGWTGANHRGGTKNTRTYAFMLATLFFPVLDYSYGIAFPLKGINIRSK